MIDIVPSEKGRKKLLKAKMAAKKRREKENKARFCHIFVHVKSFGILSYWPCLTLLKESRQEDREVDPVKEVENSFYINASHVKIEKKVSKTIKKYIEADDVKSIERLLKKRLGRTEIDPVKICVLGERQSGKSSLIRGKFSDNHTIDKSLTFWSWLQ